MLRSTVAVCRDTLEVVSEDHYRNLRIMRIRDLAVYILHAQGRSRYDMRLRVDPQVDQHHKQLRHLSGMSQAIVCKLC